MWVCMHTLKYTILGLVEEYKIFSRIENFVNSMCSLRMRNADNRLVVFIVFNRVKHSADCCKCHLLFH